MAPTGTPGEVTKRRNPNEFGIFGANLKFPAPVSPMSLPNAPVVT